MRSIKFTEAELEFLVGQYELELIEAEKYVGEITNILNKLGVISKGISGKNELKKKRGRGRPAKTGVTESKAVVTEKSEELSKKKKGKPGRPKKRGPKKGSKRGVNPSDKPVEAKITEEQKSKLREALQAMEETMGKPTYATKETQCDDHAESIVFTTRDKFQSELSKHKQMVEDSDLSLQTLDQKIADSENIILELNRECASYKKFMKASPKAIGIPTFMYSLK